MTQRRREKGRVERRERVCGEKGRERESDKRKKIKMRGKKAKKKIIMTIKYTRGASK